MVDNNKNKFGPDEDKLPVLISYAVRACICGKSPHEKMRANPPRARGALTAIAVSLAVVPFSMVFFLFGGLTIGQAWHAVMSRIWWMYPLDALLLASLAPVVH